jgi:hypothetical protein
MNYKFTKDPKNIENTDEITDEITIFFTPFNNIDFNYYKKYDEERNDIKKSFRCTRWFYFYSCDKVCKNKHKRCRELNELGIKDYFDSFNCKVINPEYHILDKNNKMGSFIYYKLK